MRLTNINTNIIEWALSYSAKEGELFVKFPKLSKWINREEFPTVKQLEKFAQATHVPFGYFFLKKEPEIKLPIPFFRTDPRSVPQSPSPELLDTIKIIQQRQAWLREYLIQNGFDKLPFVNSAEEHDSPKSIAEKIREELSLSPNWASSQPTWEAAFRHLLEKIEAIGINVVRNGIVGNNTHRKLNYKEFRGFVLTDEYAPFLFINGTDFKSAQMFTLAHELAHIWVGSSAVFDLRQMLPSHDKTEILCDKVAAEFLAPSEAIDGKYKEFYTSEDKFQKLAFHFKVSQLVIARRLLDLEYISKQEFFDFYKEYTENILEKSEEGGGNFYNNQPLRIGKRFADFVFTAVQEGNLLYRDAYMLTGLKAKTFNELKKKLYEI